MLGGDNPAGKLFFQEEVKIVENIKLETYENNPIDNFGKNMLYKMGWKDNTAIGRTNKGLIKPIEFIPRQKGLGLGAIPLKIVMPTKKSHDQNEAKQNFCGSKVKITEGLHKDLKGILIDYIEDLRTFLHENEYINVQLKLNDQVVKVKSLHLKLYDEGESTRKSRSKSKSRKNKKEKVRGKTRSDKVLKWIVPNIKVRIISRKRLDGKYYNTKAIVNDICDHHSFSVVTSDGLVFSEFKEKDLETVIPRLDDDVLILKGEYKSEVAKLLSRDRKNDKVMVQPYTDMTLICLSQDDVTALCK